MARKNQHTFAKRQRELHKAEKLAQKKARRVMRRDGGVSPAAEEETPPPAGEDGPAAGAGDA